MKIVMNQDTRFGTKRFAEGEEVDVPDRLARGLVAARKATVADDRAAKKPKKKAEPEPEPEDKKAYKTRRLKAE